MPRRLFSGRIEVPEASKKYLRKKFADEKNADKTCDCAECANCEGFVVGCKCDHDMEAIRKARKRDA